MSRKRLATNEMLLISAEWLKPQSPANKAILASNDLAPTLPRIQSAHQELSVAAQPTALNPRLFEIIKEQTDLDERHDDLIRGIFGIFTATAALLGNPEGTQLLVLRDQLLPDGLALVQKSYSVEAGEASQVSARLTPEIRAQLDKLLVGPKPNQHKLSAYIDEWIQIGAKLGTLEIEKSRVNTPDSSTTGANLLTCRNKWIRNVNLFLAIAEAIELDPETDATIFGFLRATEIKANRRGRAESAPSNSSDDPSSASSES